MVAICRATSSDRLRALATWAPGNDIVPPILKPDGSFMRAAHPFILGFSQALTYADVRRQSGPQHGPGGNSYDQKPPEHPHDVLGYQTGGRGRPRLHNLF